MMVSILNRMDLEVYYLFFMLLLFLIYSFVLWFCFIIEWYCRVRMILNFNVIVIIIVDCF